MALSILSLKLKHFQSSQYNNITDKIPLPLSSSKLFFFIQLFLQNNPSLVAGEGESKGVFGLVLQFVINSNSNLRVEMKRTLSSSSTAEEDRKMKKVKVAESDDEECERDGGIVNFDDNMLFEVLKHVDARTLAIAGCVSKQWFKTAQDERLWELICTKQWANNNTGCGEQQLRSVVLALGGFRRLHSLYLLPLSKPQTSSSSSSWGPIPQVIRSKPLPRLGKDEVHLSLSLLSIRYYEKMNFNNRNR